MAINKTLPTFGVWPQPITLTSPHTHIDTALIFSLFSSFYVPTKHSVMGGGSGGSTRSGGICAAQIKVKANNARQTFHLNNQRQWSVNSNEKGFYYATFRWQTKGVHMHTSYMYKQTHTHTIIRTPARVLSLAAIVHRINTHFKNTSSIRSVSPARSATCARHIWYEGCSRLAHSLARSLSAHKPWKCFIQRQQTKLNRTENCVSTVGPGRSAHTQHSQRTEHNKGSSAFVVAKSSPVLFFTSHTHTQTHKCVCKRGRQKLKINKSRAKSCLWQQVRGGRDGGSVR